MGVGRRHQARTNHPSPSRGRKQDRDIVGALMFETIAHVRNPTLARVLIAALQAYGFHPIEAGEVACRASPTCSSARAFRSGCRKRRPTMAASSPRTCSRKCRRTDKPYNGHDPAAMCANLAFEGLGRLVYMRTLKSNLGTLASMNKGLPLLGLSALLLLAGCASSNVAVSNIGQAEQLAPVQTGSVSNSALPPIGPNGEVQGPGAIPTRTPISPLMHSRASPVASRPPMPTARSPDVPRSARCPTAPAAIWRRADGRKAARPLDRGLGRRPVPAQSHPDRQNRHRPLPRLAPRPAASRASASSPAGRSPAPGAAVR